MSAARWTIGHEDPCEIRQAGLAWRRRLRSVSAGVLLTLAGCLPRGSPSRPAPAAGEGASIEYGLTVPEPDSRRATHAWEVQVRGVGLDPARGAPELLLDEWGSWRDLDSLYVEVLDSRPPLRAGTEYGNPFVLEAPANWDGSLAFAYRLRPTRKGSQAQRRFGLLPFASESYSCGQSKNVFVQVLQGGKGVEARRTVELRAPPGVRIVSGWAGAGEGSQRLEVDPAVGNTLLAFGRPIAERRFERDGVVVEVCQFGAAKDVSETVGGLVARLAPHMAAALGHPARNPLVVLVTDVGRGGMAADAGFYVGFSADTPEEHERSPYFHVGIAHELFHIYLGLAIRGEEAIAWFHEGFTDYFGLWHLAATGAISRTWFAERLLELDQEARTRSSLGRVAFADPKVSWRDGDGPNETMAYQGGALLAFALDAELRSRGEPGLHTLLRHLLEGTDRTASLERIRSWVLDRGLDEFWARHVAGTEPPDVAGGLARVGFDVAVEEVSLTYLGIRAEGNGPGARVVEVDPAGPGAEAGVRPGDVVTGYSPTRAVSPEVGREVATPYRFGLALFQPEAGEAKVEFSRDGQEIRAEIETVRIPGGIVRRVVGAGPGVERFFRFEPSTRKRE